MRAIRRKPLTLRKKVFFSALVTGLALVSAELLLALLGIQAGSVSSDPFVGFSNQLPLMVEGRNDAGQPVFQTAANKLVWFNFQQFPQKKAPGTIRIFCMGGSTTYGHPFDDTTSYSAWLRETLPHIDPSHQWEVINCGGISYASYRVASLMEQLTPFEPDIFIVFSAHNEFLERRTYANLFEMNAVQRELHATISRSRLFATFERILKPTAGSLFVTPLEHPPTDTLPAEVDEILNHTSGPVDYHRDPDWRNKVILHYRINLRRMVAIARSGGARMVLVAPASNERSCSPFKSELDSTLPAHSLSEIRSLVAEVGDKFTELSQERMPSIAPSDSSQWETIESKVRRILELDPGFAQAAFWLGQLQFRNGRFADASKSFVHALNNDVCPLRAITPIFQAIGEVAESEQVPLVDFERLLKDRCQQRFGHECLGEEYFLDHVHPTIEVHSQLSRWIVECLIKNRLVSVSPDLLKGQSQASIAIETIPIQWDQIEQQIMRRVDSRAHGVAMRNLAKTFHWAGKFAEAADQARDALELLPDDPESRFVLADCLTQLGDTQAARDQYALLFTSGRDWGRAYLPYAELLISNQEYARGKDFLILAGLRDPENAYIFRLLGNTHLQLGERSEALDAFLHAAKLSPNDRVIADQIQSLREPLAN